MAFQKIRESSETIFFCQKPKSESILKLIECDEKVDSLSGRSCCIICQNVPEVATTRDKAGVRQILLLKRGIGWYEERFGRSAVKKL